MTLFWCVAMSALVAAVTAFTVRTAQKPSFAKFSLHMAVPSPPLLNQRSLNDDWTPSSWEHHEISKGPKYENEEELKQAVKTLQTFSPLVFGGEVQSLHVELAQASMGQGFLLIGGEGVERFEDFSVNRIRDSFRVLMDMAMVLTFGSLVPITKVGRMAGQFSLGHNNNDNWEPYETRGDQTLPSYRGDVVNAQDFSAQAREYNPQNMVQAYHQSAQTLNILRAFSMGGYADISRLSSPRRHEFETAKEGRRYRKLAARVDESLRFMKAIGVDTTSQAVKQAKFYVGHECSWLPYEQALTRCFAGTGHWSAYSGHLLWLNEHDAWQLDGPHVEFVRGLGNPLGIEVSEKRSPAALIQLLDTLNPHNTPGRITLMVHMGADKLRECLPGLIRAVQREGKNVLWVSNPVIGNVGTNETCITELLFQQICKEVNAFFDIHNEMGSYAGGLHLLLTGDDTSIGATRETSARSLDQDCLPALNGSQCLELGFLIADRMRAGLPRVLALE